MLTAKRAMGSSQMASLKSEKLEHARWLFKKARSRASATRGRNGNCFCFGGEKMAGEQVIAR